MNKKIYLVIAKAIFTEREEETENFVFRSSSAEVATKEAVRRMEAIWEKSDTFQGVETDYLEEEELD